MADFREQVARVKSNWIGGAAGGIIALMAAKKYGKVQNKWALTGIALGGAVLGAVIQSKIIAKKGAPTIKTVQSPNQ